MWKDSELRARRLMVMVFASFQGLELQRKEQWDGGRNRGPGGKWPDEVEGKVE